MLAITGHRRDIMAMVAAFSLGMFVVYIIFGVGVFIVLQENSTSAMFRTILAVLLLVLGLMQFEDARRLHIGDISIFRTDWTKKYIHGLVSSRRLIAYFLLGALFSLVRAPCVGGTYLAIIGMISSQGYAPSGLLYLTIYNIGIALPVLVIGGIMAMGMSPNQVDLFRNRHRVSIRLITGFTLIAMAAIIYLQPI
jgi:cytochrome c-type biogenesis protein